MTLLYKLLRKDPDNRENVISVTSGLGIVVNVLLAGMKILVGLLTASIAITTEGINNASDALTSVLMLLGTKLAQKHPNEKHPFGYGRIEYLTGLVIAVLILITGVEMLISSVKLIFEPAEISISYISLILISVSAVIKFFLGIYTIKMGKKSGSSALEGVGLDCRNDSFISLVTILSAVLFLVFGLSIDAYVGILMSLVIMKAGIEILLSTVSDLIGRPGEKELAEKIYKEIYNTKYVQNAADMMLHNYGPDAWSGSVNLELDHELSVGEIYQVLHALQLRIMHEHNVTMVFGIYAVDNDHEEVRQIRKTVAAFVQEKENVMNFHAIYLDPNDNSIYCDLVVDYKLKSWDALRDEFLAYMKEQYPDNPVVLTIETKFV